MSRNPTPRLALLAVFAGALGAYFLFGRQYFGGENLAAHRQFLLDFMVMSNPITIAAAVIGLAALLAALLDPRRK